MAQASAQTSAGRETPEDRLAAERIVLPPPPKPVGAYKPWAIAGSLLITSGQFPWRDGRLAYVGRIGGNILPPDAYDACRLAAISGIAQLKDAVGSAASSKSSASKARCRSRPAFAIIPPR
jgi:enamine deaminase RidA (YjgF/YER057c/UK114 family)